MDTSFLNFLSNIILEINSFSFKFFESILFMLAKLIILSNCPGVL